MIMILLLGFQLFVINHSLVSFHKIFQIAFEPLFYWSHLVVLNLLPLRAQGSLLARMGVSRGPYGILGFDTWLVLCRENDLPFVLWL